MSVLSADAFFGLSPSPIKKRKYDTFQIGFVEENIKKLSYKEMAEKLGVSIGSIRYIVTSHINRTHRAYKHVSEDEIEFIKRNHRDLTHAEIAEALNRSKATIDFKIKELGLVKKPRWSRTDEKTLKKMLKKGVPLEECAMCVGRSAKATAEHLRVLRLPRPPRKRAEWRMADQKKLILLAAGGASAYLIAKELGRSPSTIRAKMKESGIAENPPGLIRPAWTSVDIDFMRENAGNMTVKQMAEELGKSQEAIRNKASRLGLSLKKGRI